MACENEQWEVEDKYQLKRYEHTKGSSTRRAAIGGLLVQGWEDGGEG